MQPRTATGRVALIDESGKGDELVRILKRAGYEVVREGDDNGVVVQITSSPTTERMAPSGAGDGSERSFESERPGSLAERQKMDAVARLAGGIAHDFNNLLAVISICTDEVIDAIGADVHARGCLDDIRRAVERGTIVTRDLLAFSQRDIQAPRLVDFNELVTTSRCTIERIVGNEIRLETTLSATEPLVRIDPGQWPCVFTNLALNARSAMPAGGSLSFGTRNVTLDPRERGHDRASGTYVELEVTDTGCGMTEDVRTRIFEPFFTTRSGSKSAGLGLAVVYGVVQQSLGFVEVRSEIGRGSTFRLYVPVATGASATETRRRVLPETSNAVVLVVEDEPSVRRVAVRALERSGYRVLQAGSAEEALASIDGIPIDLLVTDIVLPGINGRRLAETLTSRMPSLAVLYTSGYTDDDVIRYGAARNELAFLPKPYSVKDLVARVGEILAQSGA